jgi:predicted DNA-binding transcriptional regulator AlpA
VEAKFEIAGAVQVEMDRMLLRPAEVSDAIKVSQNSLCAWRKKGIGPGFVRLSPRVIRYRPEDIVEYLQGKADTIAKQISDLKAKIKHTVECEQIREVQ